MNKLLLVISHCQHSRPLIPLRFSYFSTCFFAGLLLIVYTASAQVSSFAQSWLVKANSYYEQKNYDSAVVYYTKIIGSGTENSDLYFNCANGYFRQSKIGLAMLYYQKAFALDPNDHDINANIRYVERLITDRIPEPDRGFLESVLWRLHTTLSLSTQLWALFVLLCVVSLLFTCALFVSHNRRLWLIYSIVLIGGCSAVLGLSVGIKIYQAENVHYAIVLEKSVDALNGPEGSKVLFTVHEGTKFRIRKKVDSWYLVSLPNGVSGWVPSASLGII